MFLLQASQAHSCQMVGSSLQEVPWCDPEPETVPAKSKRMDDSRERHGRIHRCHIIGSEWPIWSERLIGSEWLIGSRWPIIRPQWLIGWQWVLVVGCSRAIEGHGMWLRIMSDVPWCAFELSWWGSTLLVDACGILGHFCRWKFQNWLPDHRGESGWCAFTSKVSACFCML